MTPKQRRQALLSTQAVNTNDLVTLEGGKKYRPKDSDKVECLEHGVTTTYGDLTPIQRIAFHAGLDGTDTCLLTQSGENHDI